MSLSNIKIDMTVKNKLYFGFILVAALGAVIGAIGYTQLNAVNAEYDYILFKLNVIKDCSDEMVVEIRTAVEATTEYVSYSFGDKAVLTSYDDANEEFDRLETLAVSTAEIVGDTGVINAARAVGEQHEVVKSACNAMINAYDEISVQTDDMNEIMAYVDPYMEAFDAEWGELIDGLETLEWTNEELAIAADVSAETKKTTAERLIIGTSLAAVIIALGLGVVISRGIANPLSLLVTDATMIAEGNLEHKF